MKYFYLHINCLVLFSLMIFSCENKEQVLKPVLDSNCKIDYYDDSIKINIDSTTYTLSSKDDEYIFNGIDDAVAMSNSRMERFKIKNFTSNIKRISSDLFSSTIYTNNNVMVIFYDSDYRISKIKVGGYVQYGEVEGVPLSFKLDSALQERIYVYDIE